MNRELLDSEKKHREIETSTIAFNINSGASGMVRNIQTSAERQLTDPDTRSKLCKLQEKDQITNGNHVSAMPDTRLHFRVKKTSNNGLFISAATQSDAMNK